MSSLKEKIAEAISKHISIEDTYTYDLKRTKSAFEVGTMSLEDFEEWTDENVEDLAETIVDVLQPQLNENQQIVLEYVKYKFSKQPLFLRKTIFYPIGELFSNKCDDDVNDAFDVLDLKQEAEVLQAFSQWVLEQEEK